MVLQCDILCWVKLNNWELEMLTHFLKFQAVTHICNFQSKSVIIDGFNKGGDIFPVNAFLIQVLSLCIWFHSTNELSFRYKCKD